MPNAIYRNEEPVNEPILDYTPNSLERIDLEAAVAKMRGEKIEIPVIIGGKEIFTGDTDECVIPYEHGHVLATFHKAGKKEVDMAIEAAMEAKADWEAMPYEQRLAIFKKMADLIAGPYRQIMNASTMLGQSKNAFQAEIDSACEIVDFLRFNCYYTTEIYKEQPISGPGVWNQVEYRPLEGFVFAISPFNFTAIAGNLTTAPAMLGNTIVWKPSSTSVLSGYYLMKVFEEAGLPAGVINFVPGDGAKVGDPVFASKDLGGVHFTGSTGVFQHIWKTIGTNIHNYKSYPRIVGETGGKDFIFAHKSAVAQEVTTGIIRGAFEYQGQKCSATSRVYLPQTLWNEMKNPLVEQVKGLKVGSPEDYTNFVNAVIDKKAFKNITSYIDYAKESADAEIIAGGGYDDSVGYFIEPTVIVTKDPHFKTMVEEIFGPVVTIYIYEDDKYEETMELCDTSSAYALTGAIFAKDRYAVSQAREALRNCAGNFYINDKPSGAVVGQQPFGGARASGTNDKAGSSLNLYRWLSPRLIKETFVTPTDHRYPFMG